MKSKRKDIHVALCTCPPGAADKLAAFLVENRYAACVNIVPEVRSVYRWKERIEHDLESLLVIKCSSARREEMTEALVSEHPYDVPEVVFVEVGGGNESYLSWVIENTTRE